MIAEKEHAVHGRLNSNGHWELIHPKPKYVQKSFLFFKWTSTEYDPLEREEAVDIAKEHWLSGDYQDVIVLHNNFDEEGWHDYCATCIWKNGRWNCHAVNTGCAYRYY